MLGNNEAQILGVIGGALCVLFVAALILQIFYLLTLMHALERCSPRNRTMEPAMVWLNLVPCLNMYWVFHTVIQVGNSLRNEFVDRGIDNRSDYGKTIGLVYCSLSLVGGFIAAGVQAFDENIGTFASLASTVMTYLLLIVYWVKIAAYSKQLAVEGFAPRRDLDDEEDNFDDEPPPPRGPTNTDYRSSEKDDRFS